MVVVGGGPAGIAAAACAARHGARTLLIERYGFLGGMGTAGGVTNFAGLYGKRDGETVQLVHGVVDELLERIDAWADSMRRRTACRAASACARTTSRRTSARPIDCCSTPASSCCSMPGWRRARRRGADRGAIVETKSGRSAIRANAFVDATGDADLAHLAGVPYELGDGHGERCIRRRCSASATSTPIVRWLRWAASAPSTR